MQKAKRSDGTDINLEPVQTSNVIEIVSDESFWDYEDLGSEIMITGVTSLQDLEVKNVNDIYNVTNIERAIPSYINGKPVTKINYSLWLDMEKKIYGNLEVILESENKKVQSTSLENKDKTEVQLTFWNTIPGKYTVYVIGDTSIGSTEFEVKEGEGDTSHSMVEVDVVLALMDKYNIIIPPTVKEMVLDENLKHEVSKYMLNKNSYKTNLNRIDGVNFVELRVKINTEQKGQSNIGTGRVRICGKAGFNEIANSEGLESWCNSNNYFEGWEFIN